MRAASWRAVLALPFNALVVLPAILLWASAGSARFGAAPAGPAALRFWLAAACIAAGTTLMARTIRLFDHEGDGTLAPWQPPRRLVVAGVYRHVRNPMISGVALNLLGEALLLGSPAIALWGGVFFLANAVYLPLVEEPGLVRRFGDDYRRYARAVPRWIPRWRAWRDEAQSSPGK